MYLKLETFEGRNKKNYLEFRFKNMEFRIILI